MARRESYKEVFVNLKIEDYEKLHKTHGSAKCGLRFKIGLEAYFFR